MKPWFLSLFCVHFQKFVRLGYKERTNEFCAGCACRGFRRLCLLQTDQLFGFATVRNDTVHVKWQTLCWRLLWTLGSPVFASGAHCSGRQTSATCQHVTSDEHCDMLFPSVACRRVTRSSTITLAVLMDMKLAKECATETLTARIGK